MSAPFEKFRVILNFFEDGDKFIIHVRPKLTFNTIGSTDDGDFFIAADMRRKFIEAAIEEKLQRERETPQP